jgi:hypothetical protein
MTSEPTEQEIRTFVGKNSNYYLRRWSTLSVGGENEVGFNNAAFWLSGLWLPYRKMYKVSMIFYGATIAYTIFEYFLFIGILKYKELPNDLYYLVCIIFAGVCGKYGNRWYYLYTCSKIAEVRRSSSSEESRTQVLLNRGGTSWSAALGFFMMAMILLYLVEGIVSIIVSYL